LELEVIMRIAAFLVFGSILAFLVFGALVGFVTWLLLPGRARGTGFKSTFIGEAGSVVGGLVANVLDVGRRRHAGA
jgi:uncharacterized membrane protein YeaQ/YmgE (transglycosylase-associated protein family)